MCVCQSDSTADGKPINVKKACSDVRDTVQSKWLFQAQPGLLTIVAIPQRQGLTVSHVHRTGTGRVATCLILRYQPHSWINTFDTICSVAVSILAQIGPLTCAQMSHQSKRSDATKGNLCGEESFETRYSQYVKALASLAKATNSDVVRKRHSNFKDCKSSLFILNKDEHAMQDAAIWRELMLLVPTAAATSMDIVLKEAPCPALLLQQLALDVVSTLCIEVNFVLTYSSVHRILVKDSELPQIAPGM